MGGVKEEVEPACATSCGESPFIADVSVSGVRDGCSARSVASPCVGIDFVGGTGSIADVVLGELERRRLRGGLEGGIFSVSNRCSTLDVRAFRANEMDGCLNLEHTCQHSGATTFRATNLI